MIISNAFAAMSMASLQTNLLSFAPLLFMFFALYFIMIRPQMKRQKEHRNMLASLTKGDEVITGGGVSGKIIKVDEVYVNLEIADNVVVKIQKSAIVMIVSKGTIKKT